MKKLIHFIVIPLACALIAWVSLVYFRPSADQISTDAGDIQNVGATVFFDSGAKAKVTTLESEGGQLFSAGSAPISEGDTVSDISGMGVRIQLRSGAEIRLSEGSILHVVTLRADETSFLLEKGEAWGTTIGNNGFLRMYTHLGVAVNSRSDMFDVRVEDDRVVVFAAMHPVRVALFSPPTSFKSFRVPDVYLNTFFVTEGSEIAIPRSKIDPVLGKLLYSKLVKNFTSTVLTDKEIQSRSWFAWNLQREKDRHDRQIASLKTQLHDDGYQYPQGVFGTMHSLWSRMRAVLIFRDEARKQYRTDIALAPLHDAFVYYATSQSATGDSIVESLPSLAFASVASSSPQLRDTLMRLAYSTAFLQPSDGDIYRIREQLRRLLLTSSLFSLPFSDSQVLLRSYLADVDDALRYDPARSELLMKQYFDGVHMFFSNYTTQVASSSQSVAEDLQILYRLFLQDPLFYGDSYISELAALQSKWMSLLPDGRDKKEERQVLTSFNVDLIRKMRGYFFDERIAVTDARLILLRLMQDITAAIPDIDTGSASYFQESLTAQQDFWLYVNSPDYATSQLYGTTHKERFVAFQKAQKENKEIAQLQQGLVSTLPQDVSDAKDTLVDIQKAFQRVGVSKLRLAPLLDKDQQSVFIQSAEYSGIPFSAIYDRSRRLVSDVIVYNEKVFSSAVPIDALRNVFRPKTDSASSGKTAFASAPEPSQGEENRVEKVAKLFLINKLSDLGIQVSPDSISTLKFDTKTFHITSAKVTLAKETITFDATVTLADNTVTDVQVSVLKTPQSIPGSISLADLPQKVKDFYQVAFAAQIEKDKSDKQLQKTP